MTAGFAASGRRRTMDFYKCKSRYSIPEFNSMGVATYLPVEIDWLLLRTDDGIDSISIVSMTITEPVYGEA
jgi:hypothetical protein